MRYNKGTLCTDTIHVGFSRRQEGKRMDFFRSMFTNMSGKSDEIDRPIFTKPYVDKTEDMLELARRLDHAPEEAKPLFRDAMESLAAKIMMHQKVHVQLEKSDLPVLILYDVHIFSKAGSTTMDFVVLSNRFLLTISCPAQEDAMSSETSRATAAPGVPRHYSSSEHSAYILTELAKAGRHLSKKDLQMIWPITILSDTEDPMSFADPVDSFPSSFSQAYPEIHRAQTIRPDELIDRIKQLYQFDKGASWLTNRELYAISDILLAYEESAAGKANYEK